MSAKVASRAESYKGRDPQIDIMIGCKIRQRRVLMGLSQEKLAELVGVTFQQIQKYEKGTSQMSIGRLVSMSRALAVPLSFFFEDLDTQPAQDTGDGSVQSGAPANLAADNAHSMLMTKETLELVRHYYSIRGENARQKLLAFLKTLSSTSDRGE